MLAFAALNVSGCADILTKRGIGFGKGLIVGGYFLFIGVYSAIVYTVIYEGERTLRPWYLIAVFVICMIFVGITEEFLCRGVLAELLLLVFCAIYFTVRIRGVQFRLLKDMWRVIVDRPVGEESAGTHRQGGPGAAFECFDKGGARNG